MNHNWKYTTTGETASTINMHDCIVTEWERGDGYIALIFGGGFCVNDGSEHNRTGRHLLTGRSALVLRGGALISAEIDRSNVKQSAIALDPTGCYGHDVEVIGWKYNLENKIFYINGILMITIKESVCPVTNLCFSCEAVIYCWNDYAGDVWYENYHRFIAIQEAFKKLGYESHVITLTEPAQRCLGAGIHDTVKISVFKRPDCGIVYEVGSADDNSGFVIRTAQNIAAAECNELTVAATFADSINATELKTLVEKWLETRINLK
jgi:hypothetical protein